MSGPLGDVAKDRPTAPLAPAAGDGRRARVTSGATAGTSGSPSGTNETPRETDRRADWHTFLWIAGITLAFAVVEVFSAGTEAARGADVVPGKTALYDFTSVAVLLALFPAVAELTSRAMPGSHGWRRVVAVHAPGILAVSSAHILGMVLLRKALHPLFFGGPYTFTDNLLRDGVYELRKDVLTYAVFVMFLTLGRELAQKNRALAEARSAAEPRMLTYRSGGRTLVLPASDILWARAEGNYAEIHTRLGKHFVRTTLKSVASDLERAGSKAARVHRSYLVVPSAVREAVPTGNGDLTLTLTDGAEVPASRRYREALDLA